jgi:hypothetical protein
VLVVELLVLVLVLVQGVAQVVLVPDEGAVQELVAEAEYAALHDQVHSWDAYAAQGGLDAGVGEDLVEQGGELRVPVPE